MVQGTGLWREFLLLGRAGAAGFSAKLDQWSVDVEEVRRGPARLPLKVVRRSFIRQYMGGTTIMLAMCLTGSSEKGRSSSNSVESSRSSSVRGEVWLIDCLIEIKTLPCNSWGHMQLEIKEKQII